MLPKGTRDFSPDVSAKRAYIIGVIKRNFKKYGFSPLETSSMENLSVLTGKYGEEGDQLIYRVLNSGDFLHKTVEEDYRLGSKHLATKISEKGLRYDLTVPLARYVVTHRHEIPFPFKRFQIQTVWRGDNPQKGRYREFCQCDADIIGSKSIWNEVELMLLIHDVFQDLGLADYVVKINHRGILFALAQYVGLEGSEVAFCAEIDKLEKIGEEKVMENVLNRGGQSQRLRKVMELFTASELADSIARLTALVGQTRGIEDITAFFETLKAFETKASRVTLDLSLARGLSYYTGIIFEVKPTSTPMGSLCGGGRYDDLTLVFGLKDISGVGISFGLDRIYHLIEEGGAFPYKATHRLDVLIVHFNAENKKHGQTLVMALRDREIKADLYPNEAKIQKQLHYAHKINVPYTLIIGDEEMQSNLYSLKEMMTGKQQKLGLEALIKKLQHSSS